MDNANSHIKCAEVPSPLLNDQLLLQAEKTHQGLIQGVETFSSQSLKTVKTREPQSPTSVLQVLTRPPGKKYGFPYGQRGGGAE